MSFRGGTIEMFVLETIKGGYVINTLGQLSEKPCKPMKFPAERAAKDWAQMCGVRTPLIPVDVRDTDGY